MSRRIHDGPRVTNNNPASLSSRAASPRVRGAIPSPAGCNSSAVDEQHYIQMDPTSIPRWPRSPVRYFEDGSQQFLGLTDVRNL
jgi:hypothetical protein